MADDVAITPSTDATAVSVATETEVGATGGTREFQLLRWKEGEVLLSKLINEVMGLRQDLQQRRLIDDSLSGIDSSGMQDVEADTDHDGSLQADQETT